MTQKGASKKAQREAAAERDGFRLELAKKITPKTLVSSGATEGFYFGQVRSIECFTTDLGETVCFLGDLRLRIEAQEGPGLEVAAGRMFLPDAAETYLAGACLAVFLDESTRETERFGMKRCYRGPDGETVDFAFRLWMHADENSITGYVWRVEPLIRGKVSDGLQHLRELVAGQAPLQIGDGK